MNPVYLRLALYVLAPLLAMLPGVAYDEATGLLSVHLETALLAVTGGAVAAGGIFAAFGKK